MELWNNLLVSVPTAMVAFIVRSNKYKRLWLLRDVLLIVDLFDLCLKVFKVFVYGRFSLRCALTVLGSGFKTVHAERIMLFIDEGLYSLNLAEDAGDEEVKLFLQVRVESLQLTQPITIIIYVCLALALSLEHRIDLPLQKMIMFF